MGNGTVTRADVARHAGTSTAVVSYVVNEGPRPVAPETRRRVMDSIAALGYRPNRLAQALRGHRTRVMGLIVPDISNPFYAELARAIERMADLRGYTLVLGNSGQDPERELRYVRTFLDRKVDGLFLISGSSSEQLAALASEGVVPLILLDRRVNYTEDASLLATDSVSGAIMATRHLLAMGHTDIVALCGPARLGSDRAGGYAQAMMEAGLPPIVHHSPEFDRLSAYALAREILLGSRRPTAVFASNDLAGISILRAAADLGVAVPGDLAVVAYDDIQEGQFSTPRLTTVAQPIEDLGREAVTHLIGLIEGGLEAAFGMKLLAPRLVIRESCGYRASSEQEAAAT
jgi:LacI family transcriptional regulator